ncbi:MAG: short-chain dehydrogenase [Rickettsiaceae bacterium]|jgi:short-subunit dehydrogenase|nr:short-chain dehydrogenase [Rickettsiaceae bacterium]
MKHILITGASSGIGAELARQYAKNGVTLYLTGRNSERLDSVKIACEGLGAKVSTLYADIKDAGAISGWIGKIPKLDLAIANAGISAGTGGGGESDEQVRNIFDTNIYGVINTVHPAVEIMRKTGQGQIAIISSLAGYRGLPSSPAYSASKAAVKVYGEGLRGVLAKDGIGLSVITPGYIRTPMTAVNQFFMPFIIDVDKAASIIIRRLRKNPARIAFPWPLYFVVWLLSALPPCMTDWLFALLPEKSAKG